MRVQFFKRTDSDTGRESITTIEMDCLPLIGSIVVIDQTHCYTVEKIHSIICTRTKTANIVVLLN